MQIKIGRRSACKPCKLRVGLLYLAKFQLMLTELLWDISDRAYRVKFWKVQTWLTYRVF